MPEDLNRQKREQSQSIAHDTDSLSWWSWRPGIKPRNALLIGGALAFVATLCALLGLITLTLGIIDSNSAPIQVPGIIISHTTNFDGPKLVISQQANGFPAEVLASVSSAAYSSLHNGDHVTLAYSPTFHILYSLNNGEQTYLLPGSNLLGEIFGSIALLLFGLLLLPYPLLLSHWGWRDLHSNTTRLTMIAQIVGMRAASRSRTEHTGLTPRTPRSLRTGHTWYGVALESLEPTGDPTRASRPIPFSINQELYQRLQRDMTVQITYSPQLHYVYTLDQIE